MAMAPYSTEPIRLIEEVFPQDTNAYSTLFGGRLLGLMDKAAGIAASKFARREFVTVSLDTLEFTAPSHTGDLVQIDAKVVFTSTHTAGVRVTADKMSKSDWKEVPICEGVFFMVAVDSQGRPIPIPQIDPQTDEEKAWRAKVLSIHEEILSRKAKGSEEAAE